MKVTDLIEGEVIRAKFGEPVKTGVVKMRVRKHPRGFQSPTGTFKVHEFTENQGGNKDSMFVSYKDANGHVNGWPFDRKDPPEFITFMVGNEKVTLSQALAAWRKQKPVKEGLVTEGAFVVKNKAGVEKRFKDDTSEAAKLWKNSGLKASAKTTAPKVDKKAQLDAEVWLTQYCLTTVAGWGELDSYDVMTRKVFPAMVKAIRKDRSKYSEAFMSALDKTMDKDYGIWDYIRPWLDKAAKEEGHKNFNKFCDDMNNQDLS